jgi:hypothetical protein
VQIRIRKAGNRRYEAPIHAGAAGLLCGAARRALHATVKDWYAAMGSGFSRLEAV